MPPCSGDRRYQQIPQPGSLLAAALMFSALVMKWDGRSLKGGWFQSFGLVFPCLQ